MWLDKYVSSKEKKAEVIASLKSKPSYSTILANNPDDENYALWLTMANYYVERAIGFGIYDLEDYLWIDEYEDGTNPRVAARNFIQQLEYSEF